MRSPVLGDDPLHDPPHGIWRSIDLTQKSYLASALAIGDRNRIARLRHIDPDENLCMLIHGSLSCNEDRLGPPEQPSEA
jgi:hypothetical protein